MAARVLPAGWRYQAFRFELDPNNAARAALASHAGAARFAYNTMLASVRHYLAARDFERRVFGGPHRGALERLRAAQSVVHRGEGVGTVPYASRQQGRSRHLPSVVVVANPAYTSQRCSACEHTAAESRESQAVFRCRSCNYATHAYGLAVTGRGSTTREAGAGPAEWPCEESTTWSGGGVNRRTGPGRPTREGMS